MIFMARWAISCTDCIHAVFCSSWGEYKCLVKERRIYEPENEARRCKDYKKAPKKSSEDEPKCQCKTCITRRSVENLRNDEA